MELSLFDRSQDPALDELTELSAVLSNASYAYIGWLDHDRLWFKSRYGFRATEQPRSTTACQWMVTRGQPMLIHDASQDPRFPQRSIPLAGASACLSYAGVPLVASGHRIVGALAVLAPGAGQFTAEHLTLLEVLARQITTRLELYSRMRSQEHAQRALQRVERALEVERSFVSATMDSIPALVTVLDTAGRLVRLNHPCAQLTGLDATGSAGRPFVDALLMHEDRGWATAKLREASSGQQSGPHESAWRMASASEPTRRVSWTIRPLYGPEGQIQFLVVTGQDVTEKRKMEMALQSSEARYREVVENSLGFVFTCTKEGRLTSLNAFTAETLGYSSDALLGRSLAELSDAAGAETFAASLHALEEQEEWQGSLPLRRSDGVYRRIAVRSRLMQLPGEHPFLVNHGIDVTEQYEAEEALRLATRQRELILESAGDGIYGIDMEGRVTFINQAGAQALGYTPDQLTGAEIHALVRHRHAGAEPYTRSNNPIFEALHRSEPIRMRDEVFRRKDDVEIPVEYSASPIVEDGRICGMVVAFQDVSERLRLEKMKDEFISTVSHELKTPLASLRGSLGLIQSGSLDKRPEKQRHLIDLAIGNCDRLTRLVNDILDFDKIGSGRLPLSCERVDAVNLLRRATDVAQKAAAQARINFRIDAPPSAVLADEERLLQVLSELVSNAIKFSDAGTTIRLSAAPSMPQATDTAAHDAIPARASMICFAVEDQGRGIAPEKLERIFERFEQGDASDSRDLGGTGLGLALCRSIVEQHGGRIWAESEPGKGSRFLFTVPAAE